MAEDKKDKRSYIHWDQWFKQLFGGLLEKVLRQQVPATTTTADDESPHVTVTVSKKVGELPLEVDLLVTIDPSIRFNEQFLASVGTLLKAILEALLPVTVIEFKGPTDAFTVREYAKTLAYVHLIISQAPDAEMASFQATGFLVIVSHVPQKFLDQLRPFQGDHDRTAGDDRGELALLPGVPIKVVKKEEWLYQIIHGVTGHLLIIGELPETEEYYPLLLFAPREKQRRLIQKLLQEDSPAARRFINLQYLINPEEVKEVAKQQGVNFQPDAQAMAMALEDLGGIKALIDVWGIKKVIQEYGLQNVIREYGLQNVIREYGLQNMIKEYGVAETLKAIRELVESGDSDLSEDDVALLEDSLEHLLQALKARKKR